MWIWVLVIFAIVGAIIGGLSSDNKEDGCLPGCITGLFSGGYCLVQIFIGGLSIIFVIWLFKLLFS